MPSGNLVGMTLKLTTGREVMDGHSHFPTAMVINVACGPMTYKTQILAHHLCKKPIVDFCDGTKKSDLDDIAKECSIFNVKTL